MLHEIQDLVKTLVNIVDANKSASLQGEIIGLQASLALINNNIEESATLYEKAMKIAKEHSSFRLVNKLEILGYQIIKKSKEGGGGFENMPLLKRIQESQIEDYLKEIVKMQENISLR